MSVTTASLHLDRTIPQRHSKLYNTSAVISLMMVTSFNARHYLAIEFLLLTCICGA